MPISEMDPGFFNTIPASPFKKFIEGVHTTPYMRPEMKFFNHMFYEVFAPDITGYTLAFMVPPEFKFVEDGGFYLSGNQKSDLTRLIPFAAVDFTPPVLQVSSGSVQSRTGGVPYTTEVVPTNSCSITYIDNQQLDIYNFHLYWIKYMKALVEGDIKIDKGNVYIKYDDSESSQFGTLDYVASLYIVKYDPSMSLIKHVSKCTGIAPQGLPSKELIGQRTSNDVTTLPFTYTCAWYDETMNKNHPIWKELEQELTFFNQGYREPNTWVSA